jgi:hypothetical protein
VGFGEVFEFVVDGTGTGSDGATSPNGPEASLKIECQGKGLFAPCYGHIKVPFKSLQTPTEAVDDAQAAATTRSYPLVVGGDLAGDGAFPGSNIITDNLVVNGISSVTTNTTSAISSLLSTAASVAAGGSGSAGSGASSGSGGAAQPAALRLMTVQVTGRDADIAKQREKLEAQVKTTLADTLQVSTPKFVRFSW